MGRDKDDDEPVGFLAEVFEHHHVRPEQAPEPPEAEPGQPAGPTDSPEAQVADADVPPDPLHPGRNPEPGPAGGSGVVVDELTAELAVSPTDPIDPTQSTEPIEPRGPVAEADPLDRALIDQAMRKSGLVWVATDAAPARAAWYVWLAGSAYVLTGSGQQPDPRLADGTAVRVTARSKETRAAVITWAGVASGLRPSDPQWDVVAPALAKARLNLPDPATAPARWAADPAIEVYRIAPAGAVVEAPGRYSDASRRAEPVPTPAVTAGPPPKVVHRRQTARRPLS